MCNEEKFYTPTFCNQAHSLNDGKPLNHECYVIPPRLLKMEMEAESPAEWSECLAAWGKWGSGPRKVHKGKKR